MFSVMEAWGNLAGSGAERCSEAKRYSSAIMASVTVLSISFGSSSRANLTG